MADRSSPKTKTFRGLNNVSDPLRLGLSWQEQADNVNITNRNAVTSCDGYTQRVAGSAVTGSYTTEDLQRFYVVDSGALKQINSDLSTQTLVSGLSAAPMYFTEVNGQVFFTNGVDRGMIDDGQAKNWGIQAPGAPHLALGTGVLNAGTVSVCCTFSDPSGLESGSGDVAVIDVTAKSSVAITAIPQLSGFTTNVYVTAPNGAVYMQLSAGAGTSVSYNASPDTLGMELPFWNMDPPRGTIPAYWGGAMHIAEPILEADMTVIWESNALGYHHFDLGDDAIIVPGTVYILKGTSGGLLIGTERKIYLFNGAELKVLADYGVVPGYNATIYQGAVYLWTLRGLCVAPDFKNLTQDTLYVAPGTKAGAAVIEKDGLRRYVVALQKGGTPYNSRT